MASVRIPRIGMRGSREPYGSWKTIWMSRRRRRILLGGNTVSSIPSNLIEPAVAETSCMIMQLVSATAGSIRFDGIELTVLPPSKMRRLRRDIQIVFQDPYGSLDPRMPIRGILTEAMQIHGLLRDAR